MIEIPEKPSAAISNEVPASKQPPVAKDAIAVMHRFRHAGNGLGSSALQTAVLKFFALAKP
jgi:hypothetical protein